jgi:hypothetical protein
VAFLFGEGGRLENGELCQKRPVRLREPGPKIAPAFSAFPPSMAVGWRESSRRSPMSRLREHLLTSSDLRIFMIRQRLVNLLGPNEDAAMRNPRIDPQKGDVLEHQNGERRAVIARRDNDSVQYGNRDGDLVSACSTSEWQAWATQTSILGLGASPGSR